MIRKRARLFVVFFVFIILIVDLEVSELVAVLGGSNNAEPIPQVVLLQVLLGQVLQVPLGEGGGGSQADLVLLPDQGDLLAEVVGLASDLDPLVQVLLEVLAVHDAVLDGVGAVDGELESQLVLLTATLSLQLLLAWAGLLATLLLLGYSDHVCEPWYVYRYSALSPE